MTRPSRWLLLLRRAASIAKSLRFRLALSYVLFFTVLLIAIGLFFRETLRIGMESDERAALEEQWGAAKGYLKIEHQRPIWVADSSDPEEAYILERLRHVYLLTDSEAYPLEYSDTYYYSIGVDSPAEIARILRLPKPEVHIRRDKNGIPYIIRAGSIPDDKGNLYFFALGRSLETAQRTASDFTRRYFLLLPALIVVASMFGWSMAGRALRPLDSVAQAAQGITGANLSLRIARRGADDELDRLIDSFNRMTARLGKSFEQIRQFSTDVSHELRTPLTAIRGQLEVALFTAQTPEQYREAMVNALEDVENLSSIVRALLLLSQAESGQLVLQKKNLDLGALVSDVVEQFQIPAEEKHLALSATIEPGATAYADPTQIERLISNLLSNAIKYTRTDGRIAVHVSPDQERPGWTRLVVEDNGVGIPPENLPHIFDRFYRVRNAQTNHVQGLGLGLSFVAWIVSAHDGTIDVESKLNEGSRFIVHLPIGESAQEMQPAEPTTASV